MSSSVKYKGLTDAEVKLSREKNGVNLLKKAERTPWWKELLGKFNDPMIRILIVAALISIFTGGWIEAACAVLRAVACGGAVDIAVGSHTACSAVCALQRPAVGALKLFIIHRIHSVGGLNSVTGDILI